MIIGERLERGLKDSGARYTVPLLLPMSSVCAVVESTQFSSCLLSFLPGTYFPWTHALQAHAMDLSISITPCDRVWVQPLYVTEPVIFPLNGTGIATEYAR